MTKFWCCLLCLLAPLVVTVGLPAKVGGAGSQLVLLQVAADIRNGSSPSGIRRPESRSQSQPLQISSVGAPNVTVLNKSSKKGTAWKAHLAQSLFSTVTPFPAHLAQSLLSAIYFCAADTKDSFGALLGMCLILVFFVSGIAFVAFGDAFIEDDDYQFVDLTGMKESNKQIASGASTPVFSHGRRLLQDEQIPSSNHLLSPQGSYDDMYNMMYGPYGGSRLGSENGEATVTTNRLPPLCGDLVLNVDCAFKISLDGLSEAQHFPVPILSETNKMLLLVHFDKEISGRGGAITMLLPEGADKAMAYRKVALGSLTYTGAGPMVIFDKDGSAYGSIGSTGIHQYGLRCGNKEKARLHIRDGPKITLLSKEDKSKLAHAYRSEEPPSSPGRQEDREYLEVKVSRGVDPVLVLLCLLGALVFG